MSPGEVVPGGDPGQMYPALPDERIERGRLARLVDPYRQATRAMLEREAAERQARALTEQAVREKLKPLFEQAIGQRLGGPRGLSN